MTTQSDLFQAQGATLVDRDGDKIGKVDEIYEDTRTGQPEWALVNTGLFGSKSTFVPLQQASLEGDSVRVPYEKALVKDAPGVEPDGQLSTEEEQRLYQHYGLEYGATGHDGGSGRFGGETEVGGPGQDTSGPNTDSAMTRSEEELQVGKATHEAGRARLRKHVVTEQVTQTVPVQREELVVEREPVTEANAGAATDGPAISEEEHEVVLHEERPVVQKEVVAKERVRLGTETHTEEQSVSDEVRKEQIELDDDTGTTR